jgi:hypothetical protein
VAEVTLEFIGAQIVEMRKDMHEMRKDIHEIRSDITVLQGLYFAIARDMDHVKQLLGRHDARITKLEENGGA